MKGPKEGKGRDLAAALDAAAKEVAHEDLGDYRVELIVKVDNPKISEYKVIITPV